MATYHSSKTLEEVQDIPHTYKDSIKLGLRGMFVHHIRLKDDYITLDSYVFFTRARITETENGTRWEIKSGLFWYVYLLGLVYLVFLGFFLFADNVILNGEEAPSFGARLGFVSVGLLFGFLPFRIGLWKFEEAVIKSLDLKKVRDQNH